MQKLNITYGTATSHHFDGTYKDNTRSKCIILQSRLDF